MTAVSVVIPCHNYGRFLREAIESVLAQTQAGVELIVVDYESTDDTGRIVADYPAVKYVPRANRGVGVARNHGLAESAGEFVLFLDADDKLVPKAIESLVACLQAHPDCAFAYGHVRQFNASGPAQYRGAAPPGCLGEADPYGWMLRTNSPLRIPGAVLYRRRVLESMGGFAVDLRTTDDLDLNMRLARSHPICCNDRLVLEQRLHDSVRSLSRRWRHGLVDAVAAQRRQRAYVDRHPVYKTDYREGLLAARSYWGGHLAEETLTLLVGGSLKDAGQNLLTLARWHPAGLLELIVQVVRRASLRLRERAAK
ncbi:MAG TPA: glycosyltransferase [Gaiellaceae bacterium]|jgi:glycosyltransferase involved in cell wall biosynthesis